MPNCTYVHSHPRTVNQAMRDWQTLDEADVLGADSEGLKSFGEDELLGIEGPKSPYELDAFGSGDRGASTSASNLHVHVDRACDENAVPGGLQLDTPASHKEVTAAL